MKINQILQHLESVAPRSYQESYDNAQLLTGNLNWECTGVLLTLDAIEVIVEEAIETGCNLVIAHHPIVFSGLKSLTGKNYIERTIIKAIKNDIAIYACHTNLDNVKMGVNQKFADKLGLVNTRILAPKRGILKKLYTYVPADYTNKVKDALFEAGAGRIGNYSECSFSSKGEGTFKGDDASEPFIGKKGERHLEAEDKLEVLFPMDVESKVIAALLKSHPYEEVAYDVVSLDNIHQEVGSGMVGELKEEMDTTLFLKMVKEKMKTNCIRHTEITKNKVKKVAICGGAGSFLLPNAIKSGADVFITGDYKYHQFFDADGRIIIADIGHYESEQFTSELIYDILSQKFDNFAVRLSKYNTNPIKYL
ncbi:MAG: Nif3-like dinuclear metal center hexameric protein [Chitinophagales bacterium]